MHIKLFVRKIVSYLIYLHIIVCTFPTGSNNQLVFLNKTAKEINSNKLSNTVWENGCHAFYQQWCLMILLPLCHNHTRR